MVWTIEDIDRDWLKGGSVAVTTQETIAAFDRCERILGRDWVDESRGGSWGSLPTLSVVGMGQMLAALDGLAGAEELIAKVRQGDSSARTELHALYLLRADDRVMVELFPIVSVGERRRRPDLRVKRDELAWTYVEVTGSAQSKAQERAEAVLEEVAGVVKGIHRPLALEVFLRREPSAEEVSDIIRRIPTISQSVAPQRDDLPDDLGFLFLADTPPGQVVVNDHPGEEARPRIGQSAFIGGGVEPARHIAVRLAYADERAEEFLTQESRQLPAGGPGLIMINVSKAPGAFKAWEPLLLRRFQPNIHTRVSGVCLFSSVYLPTATGLAWFTQSRLFINPHAAAHLPDWIVEEINAAGAMFQAAMLARKESDVGG